MVQGQVFLKGKGELYFSNFLKPLSFLHWKSISPIVLYHNFMKKVKGNETEKREGETKILKRGTSWVKGLVP